AAVAGVQSGAVSFRSSIRVGSPMRVTLAPDVVRDLLRPPEIEDRHEPASDRPPGAVAALAVQAVDVAVGAVEPADEEERRHGQNAELDDGDEEVAVVGSADLVEGERSAGGDAAKQVVALPVE